MPQSTLPPIPSTPLRKRRAGTLASAGVLLAALTLPTVWAQQPAAQPATEQMQPAPQMRQMRQERMKERMQAHMNRFKEKLELSPEQEGAWNTFQEAMRPPAQHPKLPSREELSHLSTPERIDRMHQLREQHTSEANRRGEAAKAFYTQLNPAQRKTFDAQSLHLLERMGSQQHRGGGRQGGQGSPSGQGMMPNM